MLHQHRDRRQRTDTALGVGAATIPTPPRTIKKPSNLHLLAARTNVTDSFDERTDPYYAQAPWTSGNPWGDRLRISSDPPRDKPARKQLVRNLKAVEVSSRRDQSTVLIFTDGSRLATDGDTRTGAVFVMYHAGVQVLNRRLGLGRESDNLDGEMYDRFAKCTLGSAVPACARFVPRAPQDVWLARRGCLELCAGTQRAEYGAAGVRRACVCRSLACGDR